ncbi:hypothetical protein QJS10_CPB17g02499 [Acorus calamus]|uniref:DUF7806 domain-containing protein n=1 Tax=Acorus calamus TaxID=4465 RepID=A0AAV9CS15_ACOCL|nr:hypothetical protein QJS10_CPB17g02499 [Acorus calamus]
MEKMKETEMEKFNREQDSNFIEYVKAKMLSEELERFRNLAPEENLSGSPTVGSVGLPSSSARRRLSILDDRSHQAQNEEVGTIQNRSCQEEHARDSQRSAKAGMVFSEDISKKLDFCERGMDCSGSGLNEVGHGSDAFQALLECLIGMKVSINSRAEGLGVSILHQPSGYSFSLTWVKNASGGEDELLYRVDSLGTLERIASEWMRDDVMFSTTMCPMFFKKLSRIVKFQR